jgi:flagellar biogenesis protein FliO
MQFLPVLVFSCFCGLLLVLSFVHLAVWLFRKITIEMMTESSVFSVYQIDNLRSLKHSCIA